MFRGCNSKCHKCGSWPSEKLGVATWEPSFQGTSHGKNTGVAVVNASLPKTPARDCTMGIKPIQAASTEQSILPSRLVSKTNQYSNPNRPTNLARFLKFGRSCPWTLASRCSAPHCSGARPQSRRLADGKWISPTARNHQEMSKNHKEGSQGSPNMEIPEPFPSKPPQREFLPSTNTKNSTRATRHIPLPLRLFPQTN